MTNFQELTMQECMDTDGGVFLAACAIVGGCAVCFAGGFAIGYGLARWLG